METTETSTHEDTFDKQTLTVSIFEHPAAVLTCCVVLVVVDELRDGAEIVFLRQVKLSRRSGADVIMPAASTCFPEERTAKSDLKQI